MSQKCWFTLVKLACRRSTRALAKGYAAHNLDVFITRGLGRYPHGRPIHLTGDKCDWGIRYDVRRV